MSVMMELEIIVSLQRLGYLPKLSADLPGYWYKHVQVHDHGSI